MPAIVDTFQIILLIGVIIFITHLLEAVTGFGCTVLALPFVVLLVDIKHAVPILASLSWCLTTLIIIRSWKNISWKEYGFIAFYVLLGLPFGMYFFHSFSSVYLKVFLAVFMIAVGLLGLLRTEGKPTVGNGKMSPAPRSAKSGFMRFFLFCGGVVHGAFASGGPFVIIYASKAFSDKSLFRVTLCLVWWTMNTILLLQWTLAGNVWSGEIGLSVLCAIPFSILGAVAGDHLHRRVNETHFRMAVYIVLMISGLVMTFDVMKNGLLVC